MGHAEEIEGGLKVLKGPPIPTLLPAKGVGVFAQDGKIRFFVMSQFNNSDTTLRTPVTFRDAMRLLWNVWKERHGNSDQPQSA